jgi:3-hydroxyisobutyrate dehydrogenase-like beta-hydroxyacid dehydrogenase
MKVVVIGLGKMGSVLAKRLLLAKFDLTIFNRTAKKNAAFTRRWS